MLIVAELDVSEAVMVILNDVTIYFEDNDDGHHSRIDSSYIAKSLSNAIKQPIYWVSIKAEDIGGDDWDYDQMKSEAVKLASLTIVLN